MYQIRIAKFQEILRKKQLDAFVISNYFNILYITGFKTLVPDEREAFVILTQDNVYVLTDGRYLHEKLKQELQKSNMVTRLMTPSENILNHLKDIIKTQAIKSLGFEEEDLKFSEYLMLKESLRLKDLVPVSTITKQLRIHKDNTEIEMIERACHITDDCLREVIKALKVGMSEKEVAFIIEKWIKTKGYTLSFDPIIVAADENSAIPHYDVRDGNGVIKKNSVVLIDFGVRYNNYLSDITRMLFVGEPSDEVINTYNTLLTVQQETVKKLSTIKAAKDIDAFCRRELRKNGLPAYQHSTGHGVGLEIHEYPKISPASIDTLDDNNVFTIEPGIYVEGKWGMRVEDSVVMWEGRPKILTLFSKKPIVL